MKLYYAPGACSMAPHIALNELGIDHTTEKVDLKSKTTDTGSDFLGVNSKGYVPTLETNDGTLTEVQVILQYLADANPAKGLLPKFGDIKRYRAMEMLNFISSELHKGIGGLFNPAMLDRLLSDPQGQLTPLRGSKLWQLAALNLWLSEQGL